VSLAVTIKLCTREMWGKGVRMRASLQVAVSMLVLSTRIAAKHSLPLRTCTCHVQPQMLYAVSYCH
jgi:hypothetical protein